MASTVTLENLAATSETATPGYQILCAALLTDFLGADTSHITNGRRGISIYALSVNSNGVGSGGINVFVGIFVA